MNASRRTIHRTIAVVELLLLSPAVLFMTALFVRELQPEQYEPAHTAARIVMWYAARPQLGLWVLLMALPLLVLIIGAATLRHAWHADGELRQAGRHTLAALHAHEAMLVVAVATVAAAGVLAIVAVHSLTD